MQDYIVYIPYEDAGLHVCRIDGGAERDAVEQKIVQVEDRNKRPGTSPGELAYIVISGHEAADIKEAAALAKLMELKYIPKNITLGMRERDGDLTMSAIRKEFARRVAAVADSKAAVNNGQPFEALFRDLFGGDKSGRGSIFDELNVRP